MKNLLALFVLSFTLVGASQVNAEIKEQTVQYQSGGQVFEGVLVADSSKKGMSPGVLVVHDWMGISDDTKERARMLAQLGYVAFAADIYGKGIRPKNAEEAGKIAGDLKGNRTELRARVNAALEVLENNSQVIKNKIAAIGYCFGGTTVLELARSGAPVAGIVSFHGGLATTTPEDAKNIKAKVLVLHGADDPYVTAEEVQKFEAEMKAAGVDWELTKYSGAVHAFTVKGAGDDNSKGAAYNKSADQRSWIAMNDFFKEIF